MIFGTFSLLGSCLGIAPDLAHPIASYLAGRLFFPGARFYKPPLSYRLAEFYTREDRRAEAIEQYEEIMRHYPAERRAYTELIALATLEGEEKKASKYAQLQARRFPSRRRRRCR